MYFKIEQSASQFPSEDTLHQLDKTLPMGQYKGVRFNIQIPLEGCDYPSLLFIRSSCALTRKKRSIFRDPLGKTVGREPV